MTSTNGSTSTRSSAAGGSAHSPSSSSATGSAAGAVAAGSGAAAAQAQRRKSVRTAQGTSAAGCVNGAAAAQFVQEYPELFVEALNSDEVHASPDNVVSREEMAFYYARFMEYTTDASKRVTVRQLEDLLSTLNIFLSDIEFTEILKEFDPKETGSLAWPSFAKVMHRQALERMPEEDEIRRAFVMFEDKQRTGKVANSELRVLMLKVGKDLRTGEVESILEDLDTDKDGFVLVEDMIQAFIALSKGIK